MPLMRLDGSPSATRELARTRRFRQAGPCRASQPRHASMPQHESLCNVASFASRPLPRGASESSQRIVACASLQARSLRRHECGPGTSPPRIDLAHHRYEPMPTHCLPAASACCSAPGSSAGGAETLHYELDPVHTRVLFAVSHAGFSRALGTVSGSTGTRFRCRRLEQRAARATCPWPARPRRSGVERRGPRRPPARHRRPSRSAFRLDQVARAMRSMRRSAVTSACAG